MRKNLFCRRLLSLALTGFLSFSVAAPAPFNKADSSYLAPRGISKTTETLILSLQKSSGKKISRSALLGFAAGNLLQSVKNFFKPLAKISDNAGNRLTKETKISRRTFNTLAMGTATTAALHLTGCDGLVIGGKGSSSSTSVGGGNGGGVTILSGEPQILDIEKDFTKAVPTPLKDAQTPDTTFTLLAQLRKIDAVNFTPNFFHLTAKTNANKRVVLFPFVEKELSFAQTFAVNSYITDVEGTHTAPQMLITRAYLVEEPSTDIDQPFPADIDPTKFPPSEFRSIRPGEALVATLKGVYGTPEQTFFTYNSNDRALPSVQEPITLIRDAEGNPEPGILDAVFQNPLQLANGNDGTLRVRFATGISNTAAIQPGFVQVSIFDVETGKFLAAFSQSVQNPAGLNEFDLLASQMVLQTNVDGIGNAGDLIPGGRQLKIVVQNVDLGLTPADADPFLSVEQITYQRDANPVTMSVPVIGNSGLEIVNGTRLLKLTIDANSLPSDLLKPEFHYLRFKLSNNLEYTTTVTIPSVVENGVSVPLAGPHEYYVEIPANLISILPVTLQTVEIFNVRRGYQSVSTGVIPVNETITSNDAIASIPAVSNVAVNEDLITFTVNPNDVGSDSRVNGHNLTFNLVKDTGEAISFSTFYTLPTRLALVNGVITEVPDNTQPHDLKIKIKDPSVLAFLQNGTVTLTTITVNNGSAQVPSGPTITVTANLAPVTLSTVTVDEIPAISGAVTGDPAGLGDTVVNIPLQVNSTGVATGGVPEVLRFFFTLRKPDGSQFVIGKERAFEGIHQTDRTQTQTYSITLDDSQVEAGTVLENVTVISVDVNLNESVAASFATNLTLNPNKVSRTPSIISLGNPGSVNAQIDFTIPTQAADGTALTYPSGAPDVLMEAFTASGKYFTGFVRAADVQVVSPGVGRVFFDFSQFGNFTQTEEVFFVLRTAPPQAAFSARSAPQSGSYLVASLDLRSETELLPRRFQRETSKPKIAVGTVALGFYANVAIRKSVARLGESVERLLAANHELTAEQALIQSLRQMKLYSKVFQNKVVSPEVLATTLIRMHLPGLTKRARPEIAIEAAQVQAGPVATGLDTSL